MEEQLQTKKDYREQRDTYEGENRKRQTTSDKRNRQGKQAWMEQHKRR